MDKTRMLFQLQPFSQVTALPPDLGQQDESRLISFQLVAMQMRQLQVGRTVSPAKGARNDVVYRRAHGVGLACQQVNIAPTDSAERPVARCDLGGAQAAVALAFAAGSTKFGIRPDESTGVVSAEAARSSARGADKGVRTSALVVAVCGLAGVRTMLSAATIGGNRRPTDYADTARWCPPISEGFDSARLCPLRVVSGAPRPLAARLLTAFDRTRAHVGLALKRRQRIAEPC